MMTNDTGVSENLLNRARGIAKTAPKEGIKKDPPMDTDNMLMQPMEEWDKTDRKGSWGGKVFKFGFTDPKVRKRFDDIDWTK
jgi:hypothetical protein